MNHLIDETALSMAGKSQEILKIVCAILQISTAILETSLRMMCYDFAIGMFKRGVLWFNEFSWSMMTGRLSK